jgi:exopolyphosphatase/guanosine-5'-triphosphate,3'-diphosphate pyrophosphatase
MSDAAFLEFGSTTIKLYILEPCDEQTWRIKEELKVPWDLGYEVFQGLPISSGTIGTCLRSLQGLQRRFPQIRLERSLAVGTAALREAVNAEEFRKALWDTFRLRIHIIEGGLEAHVLEMGFREVVNRYPTAVFDLGGGSLEVVEFLSSAATRKSSLPVGVIRLHCQLRGMSPFEAYVKEARRKLDATFQEYAAHQTLPGSQALGTGGTVRTICQVLGKSSFGLGEVEKLLEGSQLASLGAELSRHRRRLLLPGLLVVERLLHRFELNTIAYKKAKVKPAFLVLGDRFPGTCDTLTTRLAGAQRG